MICSNFPYGSVEEWNAPANKAGNTGTGNRADAHLYTISIDKDATSMHVCDPVYTERCQTTASNFMEYDLTATSQANCAGLWAPAPAMSVCHLEAGVQWTQTGYGITQLRGSVVEEGGKTRLVVKNDGEYRHFGQFNQIEFSLPATYAGGRMVSNAFQPLYPVNCILTDGTNDLNLAAAGATVCALSGGTYKEHRMYTEVLEYVTSVPVINISEHTNFKPALRKTKNCVNRMNNIADFTGSQSDLDLLASENLIHDK